MAGRDFRDQNDAKKGQKARRPEAETEDLNLSILLGENMPSNKKQQKKKHGCAGGEGTPKCRHCMGKQIGTGCLKPGSFGLKESPAY